MNRIENRACNPVNPVNCELGDVRCIPIAYIALILLKTLFVAVGAAKDEQIADGFAEIVASDGIAKNVSDGNDDQFRMARRDGMINRVRRNNRLDFRHGAEPVQRVVGE